MLREHEVKGLAVSIDRTIEVTPLAADLHIGLESTVKCGAVEFWD
jgi:hypothetical protein